MKKEELRAMIQEAVQTALNELRNLEHLSGDIPDRSIIGEAWNKIVWKLGTLMDEVEGFNDTFSYTMSKMGMKEKLAVKSYVAQLEQVVKILEQLHPAIKTMTDVEQYDELHEDQSTNPHSRYAQNAGAGQFDPRTFGPSTKL